jgi:hypothetical protein
LTPESGILGSILVSEGSEVNSARGELRVESGLEETRNGQVIDTSLDSGADTMYSHSLGNIDDYVDQSTKVGDQNLGSVGTEDFYVVTLLEDGTSVGEFSVGAFYGSIALSVQFDLVSSVNLNDVNTVGGDGSGDDTGPGVSGVHALESVVNGEGSIVSLGHEEVTFLVEIEVSTTGETSDVGIVPDGASLVLNGLRVGRNLLAETTNAETGSLEGNSESRAALLGTTNLDVRSTAVTSLHELLGNTYNLSLGTVSLSGET